MKVYIISMVKRFSEKKFYETVLTSFPNANFGVYFYCYRIIPRSLLFGNSRAIKSLIPIFILFVYFGDKYLTYS